MNSETVLRFVLRKAETEFVLIIFFREAVLPIQRARLTTRTLTVTGKKSRKFYLLKLDASLKWSNLIQGISPRSSWGRRRGSRWKRWARRCKCTVVPRSAAGGAHSSWAETQRRHQKGLWLLARWVSMKESHVDYKCSGIFMNSKRSFVRRR